MDKLKVGDKVRVKNVTTCEPDLVGKIGELIAIAKARYISGHKKIYRTEYIVQFKNPPEWTYYKRNEIEKETK
jgi:hypothetical protein